ncbi:MAG: DUF3014 domain-containing protein [Rehaibacterium terrae]|uniref:DUF3014 domain-containing protein n=1 Tax=Rehaibacterium terrae TaxID=1341696 RepID=UPI00391BADC8
MVRKQRPVWQRAVGVAAVAAAIAVGVWFARQGEAPVVLPPAPPADPVVEAETGERHPIGQAQVDAEPESPETLPPLTESDAAVIEALQALADDGDPLWIPQYLVQRFVATVDNLPRQKLALPLRPVKPAPGTLRVREEADGRVVLDPANAERYARHLSVAEAVDSERAVALYVRFYPLFQQAYRELGYPGAHFNDRLVEVVDHLLAAPEIDAPLALVPEKGGWAFADPALESLSSGHKILLRIGPDNARRAKAKLRELRTVLTGESLPR